MSYTDRYIESMDADEMNRNDPTDVYSIIKSSEIREFFKHHIRLNVLEREQIILKSYISMQQKIGMMKQLAPYGTEEDVVLLDEHCRIFEKCMADIYHPAERTVFIYEQVEPYFENCRIRKCQCLDQTFDTAEELLCQVKEDFKNMEMKMYGYVSLLQIPPLGKNKNPFDFTVFWIDGCWQVKDIMPDKKEMMNCGFSERAIDRYDWGVGHFPLPFEDGSRLKLQTPFMEEAFCGILDSGCGYPGEWHHYLWDEDIMTSIGNVRGLYTRENMKNCISLSDIELRINGSYSTLDWIERA